ncbi:hypothetical protein E0Z10_g1572 [Xylaria hypoxylon]|uniref:Uncharacterized protein n=1 Tax=Xylaria hypoxylon TaxID=37992 RepID=A0A4Z0Z660_9PEZI|nr:hypothetical protein E0Z10_g1572 [Xylaria hypoxylon]
MQGDIFQLESLSSVPKTQAFMTRSKPASDRQVSIYNEDDLSHLLYLNNNPHNHHHHHHHHHTHEPRPFTHPADDAGTVFINTVVDDMEVNTPALSDCESCCGSETSGVYVESPVTPPLSSFEGIDDEALEAYRRKGRRNAFTAESEFHFGFPIFLGRQDEEYAISPPQELSSLNLTSLNVAAERAEMEKVPESQHVNAIKGQTMSWWPEPLETMEHDWTTEKTEWQLRLEKENFKESLIERERKCGVMSSKKNYDVTPVKDVEGRLMSWWPTASTGWNTSGTSASTNKKRSYSNAVFPRASAWSWRRE